MPIFPHFDFPFLFLPYPFPTPSPVQQILSQTNSLYLIYIELLVIYLIYIYSACCDLIG